MAEPLQPMSTETLLSLRHPLQPKRFALALFFALILFPLIGAALVAGTVVLIVPLFAFLFWVSGRVFYATFLGNSILVSEVNYPRIYRIGEELKTVIGYDKPVSIFVYEQGSFNAYLMKFFFYRRAVFLNSELLEAGVTDDELRWLVGRFIGYLWARRKAGFWGWTIRAAQVLLIFNLFLLPYERALVYTGDRIALAVINGDISGAISAMQKLFVGRQLGYSVNPNGIVDQHRLVKGSIFAFLARLGSGFPHLTARYVDLIGFAKERFQAQFERFEAGNPGLPTDLRPLYALPNAASVRASRDPVWASLAGAVILASVVAWATVKVLPRVSGQTSGSTPLTLAGFGTSGGLTPSDASQQAIPPPPPPPPPPPGPAPFVSAAGRFSVVFQGSPLPSTQPISLPGGQSATLYQFESMIVGLDCVVSYNDYPDGLLSCEPQAFLQRLRDISVEGGKLISDEAVQMNGVPGRSYSYVDKTGNKVTMRVFLDGQRLYQLVAIASSGTDPAATDDFISSFRIL